MKLSLRKTHGSAPVAHTLVEVVVSIFVLSILVISPYGGFSSGFAVVQLARDNLRATQIMMQKMETIRLLKWSQLLDTNNFLQPAFQDYYDPAGTSTGCAGAIYQGFVATNAASGVPNDYQGNMRAITVTIYWTNYPHGTNGTPIVRTRQM